MMIKKDSKLFILTLGLLAILPPFTVNTYASAIPNIAEHFGIHANDVILPLQPILLASLYV